VLRALEKELAHDTARTHVLPFSALGLVQMTRKRTRESLGHILCESCPTCDGSGTIKTVETICHEIAREVQRAARQFDSKGFLVLASPKVIARLSEDQSGGLAEIEAALKRPIRLQAETYYPQEAFDVVPV
jgi:ribonuclease G